MSLSSTDANHLRNKILIDLSRYPERHLYDKNVLRASAVTYLKQQGFSDSDIQKVTGHASSQMVNA
jgi:hypothetical protein